jgi:hypothetical protein
MSRRAQAALIAVLTTAVALSLVSCHRDRTDQKVDESTYTLAAGEKERLEAKATGGDWEAATQLAKYYLYGALDRSAGGDEDRVPRRVHRIGAIGTV